MSIGQSLLPEFDNEMEGTRRALRRVPDDKLDWKPDPKSMSMGRLAGHIAEMLNWADMTVGTESLDIAPGGKQIFDAFSPTSKTQLLDEFEKNVVAARQGIEGVSDQALMQNWQLLANGSVILSMPRVTVLRTMILNHIIHHRGQLMVYFRLTGVPVPGLYGPSADEGQAASA